MVVLSTFLNTLYDHRANLTVQQYDFFFDFFDSIVVNASETLKEKSYLSNLSTGNRDLTKEVKETILSNEGKKRVLAVMQNLLTSKINQITCYEMLEKFRSLVVNDETIAETTKNTIIKYYEEKAYAKFLRRIFLYAISKENVQIKNDVPADEIPFIVEVEAQCPLCEKSLKKIRKKKEAFHFSIVPIYPEGLSESKIANFNAIKKAPIDPSNPNNRICLCPVCADEYVSCPTIEIYQRLLDRKELFARKNLIKHSTDVLALDEQIEEVLNSLRNLPSEDVLATFRIEPLFIKEKIANDYILRDTIINDVTGYYHFVRTQLSNLDADGTEFNVIGTEFHLCYKKLTQQEIPQSEIYQQIIEWMMKKLNLSKKYYIACRIVVSFFVQNCEVFDEITQ